MECEIEQIGVLRNPVIAWEAGAREDQWLVASG